MYQCRKCSLPVHYPDIQFGNDGICNYCRFYAEQKAILTDYESLEKKFAGYVEQAKETAKKQGARYDCLVGFSGGKDSTYIVYQMQKKYHMRVLAFTYDNGFCTDYGRENISNTLEKMNVDYLTFKPDNQTFQYLNREAVKYSKHFCAVCFHQMHYYSLLLAKEKNIPLIVNGRSRGQVLQRALDTEYLEPFMPTYGLKQFEHQMLKKVNQTMDQAGRKSGMIDFLDDVDIQMTSYFMYHPYDAEKIKDFLEREIGWQRPKEGMKHPDCWAHNMAEYFHLQRQGFTQSSGELAVDVRERRMDRGDAIKTMEMEELRYRDIEAVYAKRFYDTIGYPKGKEQE